MARQRKKPRQNKSSPVNVRPSDIEAVKALGEHLLARVPSTSELMQLAAMFLQGRGAPSKPEMQYAVNTVLELCTICQIARDDRIRALSASQRHLIDRMENAKKLPVPKSYPVPFEKFLSTFLSSRKPSQRPLVFKKVLTMLLTADFGHAPEPHDLDAIFTRLSTGGLDKPHYEIYGLQIIRLLPAITAAAKAEKAKRAGEARWAKNKSTNSVDIKRALKITVTQPKPPPKHFQFPAEYPDLPVE